VTVTWTLPGQVRTGVPQLVQVYEMAVVDQQNGKWYVKEIRVCAANEVTQNVEKPGYSSNHSRLMWPD
jgi:hypothetical protein